MTDLVKTVWATARPNFLLLSAVVVGLGSSTALYYGAEWSWGMFALLLLMALAAHAAVNMLNEYEDFRSGLDHLTRRTPFSGGSGALPANPAAAERVQQTAFVLLGLLVGLGAYLVWLKGWLLLPLGLVGMLLIVFYTSLITRLPWFCLVAPGLAFGPVMVLGVFYVWTGTMTLAALFVSLVPFFLVNNLLLLNQYPDLQADRKVGRYNILMHAGLERGRQLFMLFAVLAFVSLTVAIATDGLPRASFLAMVVALLAPVMIKKLDQTTQNTEKLMPALAMNVIINLLVPLLMSLGVLWHLR